MADHDSIISTHFSRRAARRRERRIQEWLEELHDSLEINPPDESELEHRGLGHGYHQVPVSRSGLEIVSVPTWARGARVVKAGRFQWAVQATRTRGS